MSRRFDRRDRGRVTDDAGFTLTELVTAMAVFSILMVIVGSAMLVGFSAIRDTMARGDAQAQQQNAMEWMSRLLRYATVPTGQAGAITDAGASSLTFFTDAGIGGRNDAPARVTLSVRANADGSQTVRSQVWPGTQTATGWTWTGTPAVRDLLTVPKGATTPLRLAVFACDPGSACYSPEACAAMTPACSTTTWRDATPAVKGPLALGATERPQAVRVTIGDARTPELQLSQTIRLVNEP